MRVAFDAQIFRLQSHGGISRYFSELIKHLNLIPALDVDLDVRRSRNRHLIEAGLAVPARLPRLPGVAAVQRSRSRVHGLATNVSLLHYTYYTPSALLRECGLPTVSTVHDMTPELFPEEFQRGNPHLSKSLYVEKSDALICVSENTKIDLLRFMPAVAESVHVIPLAPSGVFRAEGERHPSLPLRYVMFVGGRNSYKNFPRLLKAFEILDRSEPDVYLVCVGGGGLSSQERRRIAEHGLDGRVVQLTMSDADMARAYRGATALVIPSLYEGFGLPVLEAMSCGCPVVMSNASALPEVGGDAAVYFDPFEAEEIAHELLRVVRSREHSRDLAARGLLRARDFSWQRTATETLRVYESLRG